MHTASLHSDSFQDVLAQLPPGLDLDTLAFSTGAMKRRRELGEGTTLLRLALARGPGGLSLNQTVSWAASLGLVQLSDPGLKYRLDQAVPFLKALVERQLAERAHSACLHWPGRVLRVVDGTHISQPGSQGYDWKVHATYDLGSGSFVSLELTDKHGGENVLRGNVQSGEVRIGDRNYANAAALQELRQPGDAQVDFIVRMRWKSFRLTLPDGTPFSLTDHLASLSDEQTLHELNLCARVKRRQPLPLRVIILRRGDAAAEATRAQLRRSAPRKQKKLDPRSLLAAGYLMLATSLPEEGYTAEAILAAYRLRWQIEMAFKRLKSLLHLDGLPTRTQNASRSWIFAHLVVALLCDDLAQEFLESFP